jgi:hypothetical protein
MFATSRRAFLLWLLAAAALLPYGPTGCKRNRLSQPAEPPPKTVVRVTNTDFLDVVVYVARRGQNVRLGTASSNTTTTFVIPSQLIFGATSLSFLIDPVGSNRRQSTGELLVDAGDELELRVGSGRPQVGKKAY